MFIKNFRKENFTFGELLDALLENNKEEKAECSQVKPEEENENNNKPGQFMNIMLKIIHSKLR